MQKLSFPLLRTIVNDHEIESVLPCPEEQRRALSLVKNHEVHTILFELQFGGDISIARLRNAWQNVVQQRRELRTVFARGPGATDIFQVVLKNYDALLTHADYEERDDIEAKIEQDTLPVLVPGAPMHVAQAYTTGGSSLLLRVCYNDIVIDSDCLVRIQTDLPRAYYALAGPKATPATSHETQVQKETHAQGNVFERMKNAEPTILGLGTVVAQTAVAEYTNETMLGSLGELLLLQCSSQGVAPINAIQALWLVLLARYLRLEQPCCVYRMAQDDVSSENSSNPGVGRREFLCTGLFTEDDRFADLVKRLNGQVLEDIKANSSTDFPLIHDGKRICNSSVCWYDLTASNEANQVLSMKPVKAKGSEEHDVALIVIYTGAELMIQLRTGVTIETWLAKSIADMFMQSLEYVLSKPECRIEDIPSCSQNDIYTIQRWNGGDLPRQESCIHEMIREQALLRPDAPAVLAHDGSLSYAGLEALTTRVANTFFTKLGFQHEEKIILQLPHSLWVIVAMLSVMKAGSAFVSLDENVPLHRVKSIALKSNARFVLTTQASTSKYDEIGLQSIVLDQSFADNETLPTAANWTNSNVRPSDLAYVIFTSGSTGEPKGCAIEHRAFCSYALTFGPAFRLGPDSRVIQSTSYSFDVSLKEIFLGLLSGSCLCIPSDYDIMNDIGGAAARMRVNYANFTPSVAAQLNLEAANCIRTLVLGGEALTPDIIAAWVPRVDVLLGGYGPSEVCPTSAVVGPLSLQSNFRNIGSPIGNKSWVVDPSNHDRLMPVGAVGELVLESHAIGRGYIGDEERTSKVFIENPAWCAWPDLSTKEPGEKRRMYKTGDLVARCGDGSLLYFGRKDMQVKLRGQRIELGDIESNLKAILAVDLAVEAGIPRGGGVEDKMLVAFICLGSQSLVPTDLTLVDPQVQARLHTLLANCEERLAEKIARYMLPSAYVPLRMLPVTTSGKRDRRGLQQIISSLHKQELLAWHRPAAKESKGRPIVTEMGKRVASLWSKVLKIEVEDLSLDDDFVNRGGDSLAAMKVANLAKEAGLRLTFRDIYRRSRILGDQIELCLKGAASTTATRMARAPRSGRALKPNQFRGESDTTSRFKHPVVIS
ncbi:acetyl-CoA synthetase-like protein [Xylaria bambusicola]|uniref:acetyl-CoA synthetase-like protein n=1 Tax=Xylaria bambusicola TaxID=326684 RepID=UPI0020089050|nr:acetyl-CoA synthetase-like protein [Xylaria bambusicola]KAI0517345.1 acetyl-CoA synthetase-like protein [Xylaria bambusicola]